MNKLQISPQFNFGSRTVILVLKKTRSRGRHAFFNIMASSIKCYPLVMFELGHSWRFLLNYVIMQLMWTYPAVALSDSCNKSDGTKLTQKTRVSQLNNNCQSKQNFFLFSLRLENLDTCMIIIILSPVYYTSRNLDIEMYMQFANTLITLYDD